MALPRGARQRAPEVLSRLKAEYPEVACALNHRNAYELLVATILSAQCTDERVNMVTPALFERYPSPADLAAANPSDVEELVRSTGFFQQKAKNIIAMASALEERYEGQVPTELDDLTTLAGVGRKTGNVIRSVAFDLPGLPVDTHVTRLSNRLKLTNETDAVKIERDLNTMIPPEEWGDFSLRLIEHGRRVCDARKPRCGDSTLGDLCPFFASGAATAKRPARRRAPR